MDRLHAADDRDHIGLCCNCFDIMMGTPPDTRDRDTGAHQGDFLDEFISERTEDNPDFPRLLREAMERRR